VQEHQNEDLYEKAVSILETYFECEEGDDQNLAPQMAGNQYAFGQQTAQVIALTNSWWDNVAGQLPEAIQQVVVKHSRVKTGPHGNFALPLQVWTADWFCAVACLCMQPGAFNFGGAPAGGQPQGGAFNFQG
jgi:hypothetical protein